MNAITEPRAANPFYIAGEIVLGQGRGKFPPGWYYYDELGDWVGPYKSEKAAVRALLGYVYWLEHGPTRWQRIWLPVKWWARDFWRDTSSGGRRDTRRKSQVENQQGAHDPTIML